MSINYLNTDLPSEYNEVSSTANISIIFHYYVLVFPYLMSSGHVSPLTATWMEVPSHGFLSRFKKFYIIFSPIK